MIEPFFNAAHQIPADQTEFVLSPEAWDKFRAALDAPPRELLELRKLLTTPGVFDESH